MLLMLHEYQLHAFDRRLFLSQYNGAKNRAEMCNRYWKGIVVHDTINQNSQCFLADFLFRTRWAGYSILLRLLASLFFIFKQGI